MHTGVRACALTTELVCGRKKKYEKIVKKQKNQGHNRIKLEQQNKSMSTRGAWNNSATTNDGLVQNLVASKFITHSALADAFRANDRQNYVPPAPQKKSTTYNYGPYSDAPQPLGFRATVSAPYVQALALNELTSHIMRPNSVSLDVGSGSGIIVGYMARLAEKNGGKVVGVEVVEPLVALSIINLKRCGITPNDSSNSVIVQHGNGRNGFAEHGPFDAIHVGAQASEIPQLLLDQLKPGGRMIIPVGPLQEAQQLMRVDKDLVGNITQSSCGAVRFVPLVKEKEENAKWTRKEKDVHIDASTSVVARGAKTSATMSVSESNSNNKNNNKNDNNKTNKNNKNSTNNSTNNNSNSDGVDWNKRYKKGWAYGKLPNEFLVQIMQEHVTPYLPVGPLNVLCIADGQGRNGVYMASLGHKVTAIDVSSVGMRKAKLLAEQTLCCPELLTTIVCDVDTWVGENDDKKYDIIVDIFSSLNCGQNGELRKARMDKWDKMLQQDGWYINECFAPRHDIVRDGRASGPKQENLISCDMFKQDTREWLEIIMNCEVEKRINEGKFHRGPCVVTQFVGRKPQQATDVLQSYHQTMNELFLVYKTEEQVDSGGSGGSGGSNELLVNDDYTAGIMNIVTAMPMPTPTKRQSSGEEQKTNSNSNSNSKNNAVDHLLFCSEESLRIAVQSATKNGRCRYCWLEQESCLCDRLQQEMNCSNVENGSESKEKMKMKTESVGEVGDVGDVGDEARGKLHPIFTVICHPNECLRSTSTAKIAVMSAKGSRMLVYGARNHRRLITDAVGHKNEATSFAKEASISITSSSSSSLSPTFVLFPEGPSDQTCSVDEMVRYARTSSTSTSINILVPDGSWECCRSIVQDMSRMNTSIQFVRLNQKKVNKYQSPLIEALKEGQGQGRITTLEACALLCAEMNQQQMYHQMLQCMKGLTEYILRQRMKQILSFRKPRYYTKWLEYIRHAAAATAGAGVGGGAGAGDAACGGDDNSDSYSDGATGTAIILPLGLRSCTICCETLATPVRMLEHVCGKKHCERVFRTYLSSSSSVTDDLGGVEPNIENAKKIYQTWSTDLLAHVVPEPPDIALVVITASLNRLTKRKEDMLKERTEKANHTKKIRGKKSKINRGQGGRREDGIRNMNDTITKGTTKGERLYQSIAPPKNVKALPLSLRQRRTFQYDTTILDLRQEVLSFLERASSTFGSFPRTPHLLEEFQPHVDVFRNFDARQLVYNAVLNDQQLLNVYDRLIRDIVVPYLKQSVLVVEKELTDDNDINGAKKKEKKIHTFYYQYPPTLRIQPGPARSHGRTHRDAEYGHQKGEINYWMPISYYSLTRTTLEVEQTPGSKDFKPLNIEYGDIGQFHGTLCHHRAPPNLSVCTRISFDFRIGIDEYYDNEWKMNGIKAQHGRKIMTL